MPAPLRAPLKVPLPLPPLVTGLEERECADPDPDPEVVPLAELLEAPVLELPELLAPEVLGEEAVEGPAAEPEAPLPDAAAPPPEADELGGGDGGGLLPGMPAVGVVQAHARLTPTTAVARTARTANEKKRTGRCTRTASCPEFELFVPLAPAHYIWGYHLVSRSTRFLHEALLRGRHCGARATATGGPNQIVWGSVFA